MSESELALMCRILGRPPGDRQVWVDGTAAAYLAALEANDRPEWSRIRRLAAADADLAQALDDTLDSIIEEWQAARAVGPAWG